MVESQHISHPKVLNADEENGLSPLPAWLSSAYRWIGFPPAPSLYNFTERTCSCSQPLGSDSAIRLLQGFPYLAAGRADGLACSGEDGGQASTWCVLCSTNVGVVNESPPAANFDIVTVKDAALRQPRRLPFEHQVSAGDLDLTTGHGECNDSKINSEINK